MNTILCWLNNNNGALMVVITLVYVIATINISRSNRKSAEASHKQIAAAQKQQELNVALQLYAMRKEVINKLLQKQFNEVFGDIPLLFTDDLYSKFQKIASKAEKIEYLQKSIKQFETELNLLAGPNALENIRKTCATLGPIADTDILKETVLQYLSRINKRADYTKDVEEYAEQVNQVRVLEHQVERENSQLILEFREFIKQSIQ